MTNIRRRSQFLASISLWINTPEVPVTQIHLETISEREAWPLVLLDGPLPPGFNTMDGDVVAVRGSITLAGGTTYRFTAWDVQRWGESVTGWSFEGPNQLTGSKDNQTDECFRDALIKFINECEQSVWKA